MSETILYDYWRSSACYRVRIALGLLDEPYRKIAVDLLKQEQKSAEHLERNPQALVPVLQIDGHHFTQSLAIIEYLNETRHAGFLPKDSAGRERVRALSYAIAMEIHPICNLRVVTELMEITGDNGEIRRNWMRKFIGEGLAAFERLLDNPQTGSFCHGDRPTMADICLIPQLYNARRWDVDLSNRRQILKVEESCARLTGFADAYPRDPDKTS